MSSLLPFDDLRPVKYMHVREYEGIYLAVSRDGMCYWSGHALGFWHNVFFEALQRKQLDKLPQTEEEARAHFPTSDQFRVIEEAVRRD